MTAFSFAPHANGVAEVVREQACGLAALGHQVTVATEFEPRRTKADTFGKLTIQEFKVRGVWGAKEGYKGEIAEYQNFIAQHETDVILYHGWEVWSTDLAVSTPRPKGALRVLVSHGIDAPRWKPFPKFPWGLPSWMRRSWYALGMPRMLRRLDHVVFLSPRIDRYRFFDHWMLQRFGGPTWSAIPNGCWPEKFSEQTTEFRTGHGLTDRFVVLCVATYAENKNQELTLRTFCSAKLSNATLVFVGNEINDYARDLKGLAESLMPPGCNVLFLEKQTRAEIEAAYQAADLVALTSNGETQPLVLLDAMASGKPFLSTNVGCVSDFPGGIVAEGKQELVNALRSFYDDPNRRKSFGEAGLAAARSTYHWKDVVRRYDELFHDLRAKRANHSQQ